MQKILKHVLTSCQPLNTIEISQSRLLHNYHYLLSLRPTWKIAPVLKSNAYGHGLVQVAKILDLEHPPFFCVNSLYEGYELVKAGIKTPILIMGYVKPENVQVKKLPFSYALYDRESAKALSQYQPGSKVHIFVDTGMHREGIPVSHLRAFVRHLKLLPNIRIEGLMSHLAVAGKPKDLLTKKQLVEFEKAKNILREEGIVPTWIHLTASDGISNREILANTGNVARVGLALYGISYKQIDKLQPVLTLTTTLVQIKSLHRGEKVGYDFTYTANSEMKIGVLPIGYNDGVDIRLSNKGFVYIGNVACKIVGRVSMNITTIDITDVKNPFVGQKVTVYSSNNQNKNSILQAARICGTIPYELLVHLASSTRRVVIK